MCQIKECKGTLVFGKTTKLTTIEFIRRAIIIHGDKYDYSLVEYIDCYTKVKIICRKCNNIFEQTPTNHINRKRGCKECGNKQQTINKSLTTEEFILKAIIKHGNKFDYSLVVYINSRIKVKIKCNSCNRIFEQTPIIHLYSKGCPICYKEIIGKGNLKNNFNFITKAILIHNNLYDYDYSLVIYTGSRNKVKIICNRCKIVFEQIPSDHLSGNGCKICNNKEKNKHRLKSKEYIIKKFNLIHKEGLYLYDKMIYLGYKKNIEIFCTKCNNYFFQTVCLHMVSGCPNCNKCGGLSEERLYNYIKNVLPQVEIIRQFKPLFLNNGKSGSQQSFDIYLPEHNIAIEYQGKQHFKAIRKWGGKIKLIYMQKLDERKRLLCIENDVKLFYFTYRISEVPKGYPHKIFNIENELFNQIKKCL